MGYLFKLVKELRRRKVLRGAGIYIVAAWVFVQVFSLVLPAFNLPDSAIRYVWIFVILIFPLAMGAAWRYEITDSGLARTPPAIAGDQYDSSLRKTDYVILAALAIISLGVLWQLTSNFPEFEDMSVEPYEVDTIAVLPLENLSADPEQEYFVSGMQDALIAGLSRIGRFRVTSKTSTNRYRDTVMSLPLIAAELGVGKLIEGSVYRVGSRVRISVVLIDALADKQMWSETFEEDIVDIMTLQNQVARSVAKQVRATAMDVLKPQPENLQAVNRAAYDTFLKGNFHLDRFTPQDMQLAASYFRQTIAIDPEYALAYYGLAKLCLIQAQVGFITPTEAQTQCREPIEKALEIDDGLAEAVAIHAAYLTWIAFDWDNADLAYRKAIEINPSMAEARASYGHFLTLTGRTGAGLEQMREAVRLDPFNPLIQGFYGAQLTMIGESEMAIKVIEDAFALNPGIGFGSGVLWHAYANLGDWANAIPAAIKTFQMNRLEAVGAKVLEEEYAGGDYKSALLKTADAMAAVKPASSVRAADVGSLYAMGGDYERAIDWFRMSYELHQPDAPYLGVFTESEAVRHNPRFIALLREMGLDYWADQYSLKQSGD